jgi:glucose 1-dehydrogenase
MSEVKNYNKKVAVVTGSSRGIGKAIAIEFAKAGYSIVINARNEEELKNAADAISKTVGRNITNDKLFKVAGDVSQEQACISLIQETVKRFGRIDVLVNNAGISDESKRISEITSVVWDKVLDTNLKGAFLCTRETVKHMLNDNNDDQKKMINNNDYSIINISSVHESIPLAQSAPYGASKGGMELLTKTVALELADKGIRVNGIAPGAIATDMNKEVLEDKEKKIQEEDKIPMHRIGRPEEIAKVALFLASSDASYITGTTIYVDGGLTLSS